MKLLRAEFENFRLLKNLSLNFSTDDTERLTVIRAENETGKTTILTALQWALYGDDALPGKGDDYRLHPISWDVSSDGKQVPISVQVEFEKTTQRRSSRGPIETTEKYRIIRSVTETIEGSSWNRSPSTVKLLRLTDTGSKPVEPPEAEINDILPPELREVFFTDGDRALSFIESSVSTKTKRERVEKAIRSLLGLGILDNAIKHVKKTSSEVNKKAKSVSDDRELNRIADDISKIDDTCESLENQIADSKEQASAFDEKIAEVERKIEEALKKGDREKLNTDINNKKQAIKRIDDNIKEAAKEHSDLLKSLPLARDLLAPVLERGLTKLSELHNQGKIPNTTIPVLEERLRGYTCICGETLDPDDTSGERRRQHIQHLIDKNREADQLQSTITDLYFGSQSLQPSQVNEDDLWITYYQKLAGRRDELEAHRDEEGSALKVLEAQLDEIPDTNIKELRATKASYKDKRDQHNAAAAKDETRLEQLKEQRTELVAKRNNLWREQKKGQRMLAELTVAQDIEHILQQAYNRISNEELGKVSELMNEIFLEMIGADPNQGAIIRRAMISKDFDIVVQGPNERVLDPDQDLNGASRRALTLSFILALTKVSEVEAPNVIDTPLGMMSGYVKKSVLSTAIRESSQLILFLTRSEIMECEDILDDEAGQVLTLTNSAHYPRMLVHDPEVDERMVLRCECDHRQQCQLCERYTNVESQVTVAS